MPNQLPLPLEPASDFSRDSFVVGPGNRDAVSFLELWPNWPAPSAAIYGPAGSGKTHLARIWAGETGAGILSAASLGEVEIDAIPYVVENLGIAPLSDAGEQILFALIERGAPLLLTGREPPAVWPVRLPDLASRTRSLLGFPLWTPDDEWLRELAKNLFAFRQLMVPESVAAEMVKSLERSPAAICEFVARADSEALARRKPVSLALVKDLLANPV